MEKEQWKDIEEASNYEVSNLGRVRNKITKHILAARFTNSGYIQVCIKIDKQNKFMNRYNHRLAAKAWIPNSENKPEVNHKDGNKENNNITNLEWVTGTENQLHRATIGKNKTSNRRVGKFDKNNNLIAEYNSIAEAAKQENSSSRVSIDNVLQGRRKTLKGFVWKYLD